MRKDHKITFGLVVLNALCAICWCILSISDICKGHDMSTLILHLFCTVLWTLTAVLNYFRFRRENKPN